MDLRTEVVFEPAERIVSMVEHKGSVYLATERRVYRMRRDEFADRDSFHPVVFHQATDQ